jgi:hypothetical protein
MTGGLEELDEVMHGGLQRKYNTLISTLIKLKE